MTDDASCSCQIRNLWINCRKIIEIETPVEDWAASGYISQVTYIGGLECKTITSCVSVTDLMRALPIGWINLKQAISGSDGQSGSRDLWVQSKKIIEIEPTNERHSLNGMSLVTYEHGKQTKTITSQMICADLLRLLESC